MPPRARKTAAAAPDQKDGPTPGGEVKATEPTVVGDGSPEVFVPADEAAENLAQEGAQFVAAAVAAGLNVAPPAGADSAAEAAASPTYHWQQADGRPGAPCRLCAPAGPPPGAGSFGCAHGQWVLAPDVS